MWKSWRIPKRKRLQIVRYWWWRWKKLTWNPSRKSYSLKVKYLIKNKNVIEIIRKRGLDTCVDEVISKLLKVWIKGDPASKRCNDIMELLTKYQELMEDGSGCLPGSNRLQRLLMVDDKEVNVSQCNLK